MSQIRNIENLTIEQVQDEIIRGGKFVTFPFAVSIIVITFRRSSDIFFVKAGENAMQYGWTSFLITLFFGWWGIPFGPIFSIGAIYRFFTGGKNITTEVMSHFNNIATQNIT